MIGRIISEEQKQKIRDRIVSDETKHLLSELHKERWAKIQESGGLSDETRAKLSQAQTGNTKWLGKKHKDTTKEKMSAWQKGQPKSEEAKEKMRAGQQRRRQRELAQKSTLVAAAD